MQFFQEFWQRLSEGTVFEKVHPLRPKLTQIYSFVHVSRFRCQKISTWQDNRIMTSLMCKTKEFLAIAKMAGFLLIESCHLTSIAYEACEKRFFRVV